MEEFHVKLRAFSQKLDLWTSNICNYGYLLGLETWDPGNTGKPHMLIPREAGHIGKRTISVTWGAGSTEKQTI